ncbi:MAG: hypothetical protein IT558_04130 [Alphaproteobacteria bacterium]|nr:hypothetical protein [Alphaproteobacteria bacterium]
MFLPAGIAGLFALTKDVAGQTVHKFRPVVSLEPFFTLKINPGEIAKDLSAYVAEKTKSQCVFLYHYLEDGKPVVETEQLKQLKKVLEGITAKTGKNVLILHTGYKPGDKTAVPFLGHGQPLSSLMGIVLEYPFIEIYTPGNSLEKNYRGRVKANISGEDLDKILHDLLGLNKRPKGPSKVAANAPADNIPVL